MGQQDVRQQSDEAALRAFTRHLIRDVRALEHMLREGMFGRLTPNDKSLAFGV